MFYTCMWYVDYKRNEFVYSTGKFSRLFTFNMWHWCHQTDCCSFIHPNNINEQWTECVGPFFVYPFVNFLKFDSPLLIIVLERPSFSALIKFSRCVHLRKAMKYSTSWMKIKNAASNANSIPDPYLIRDQLAFICEQPSQTLHILQSIVRPLQKDIQFDILPKMDDLSWSLEPFHDWPFIVPNKCGMLNRIRIIFHSKPIYCLEAISWFN